MTILLILILGRLGRTAKPDSPNSATRPATSEDALHPPVSSRCPRSTVNTSNVRGNAELSEIPWLFYDFVQFLFGVLLPFVYGILKRCGARVLFEMLISTHIDIAVPLVSIPVSVMGAIIYVREDNARKHRYRKTPLMNALMIGIDVGLTMAFDPAPRPRDIIHTYSYGRRPRLGAPHERVKAR